MNITFAVGSGRCGTVSLAAMVAELMPSRHEGVKWNMFDGVGRFKPTFHQTNFPHLMHAHIGKEQDLIKPWNVRALNVRKNQIEKLGYSEYFEAAHYMSGNLQDLFDVFPDAKLIHLHRPAEQVVNSFTRRVRKSIYNDQGKHKRNYLRWVGWQDVFPVWENTKNKEEGYARYWQWTNESISTFVHKHRVPYYKVQTKELNNERAWRRILKFIDPNTDRHLTAEFAPQIRNDRQNKFLGGPELATFEAVEKFCTWKP